MLTTLTFIFLTIPAESKALSLETLIQKIPQFCQKQIGVETLVLGKRERVRTCKYVGEKCQKCRVSTRMILDLNNFPIIEKSASDPESEYEKCSSESKEEPTPFIDEKQKAYKVTFSAFPLILFSLGIDRSLKAFHLKEISMKSYVAPFLMLSENCRTLFKKEFTIWGHWDESPEGPVLKSKNPLKVKYKNPMIPPTPEERTVFPSLTLDDSANPYGGLSIGDPIQVQGKFKLITSRKFAPEMPTIPEKNSLLVFEVKSLIRKPQP